MMSRLVVDMDDELKRKFRMKTFENRLTMSQFVVDSIRNYVKSTK